MDTQEQEQPTPEAAAQEPQPQPEAVPPQENDHLKELLAGIFTHSRAVLEEDGKKEWRVEDAVHAAVTGDTQYGRALDALQALALTRDVKVGEEAVTATIRSPKNPRAGFVYVSLASRPDERLRVTNDGGRLFKRDERSKMFVDSGAPNEDTATYYSSVVNAFPKKAA